MDHDDDVERLFSWLQTPELRYREFAGAREITDKLPSWQTAPRAAPAAGPTPAVENADAPAPAPPSEAAAPQTGVPAIPPMPDRREPSIIAPTDELQEPQSGRSAAQEGDPRQGGRSLDAVFNRLAASPRHATEPRERRGHLPGLGPETGRSR